MSKEGRLARGKANYNSKNFLNNSETLEYIESIKKPKEIIKEKPKEDKDAKRLK